MQGKLVEGTDIAVKRLTRMSDSGTSQFLNEVNLISELQHFNVISLLGYCFHSDEHILVFEYHANRSLDLYIFGWYIFLSIFVLVKLLLSRGQTEANSVEYVFNL